MIYVVQLHDARRLHYDFRLEHDGVLWSWAVPKGPSLRPADRRLAVRVEDHELAHAEFEGVIGESTYGTGAVAIWDRGTWLPGGEASAMMAAGKLVFELVGAKLRGRWHLVRTRPVGKRESWLLFKGRDAEARDAGEVTVEQPRSVVSGKTLDEIYLGYQATT